MDKILKTLHLRLDSTSKSLTKNAVSQLIIKILFQHSQEKIVSLARITSPFIHLTDSKMSNGKG